MVEKSSRGVVQKPNRVRHGCACGYMDEAWHLHLPFFQNIKIIISIKISCLCVSSNWSAQEMQRFCRPSIPTVAISVVAISGLQYGWQARPLFNVCNTKLDQKKTNKGQQFFQ